jgi:Fic family protein
MRFPSRPPAFELSQLDLATVRRALPHVSPTLPDGRYLHWDELRRRPPPSELSVEQWWSAQKFARKSTRVVIPELVDERGAPFWFCRLDAIDRATHQLDRQDATRAMIEAIGDAGVRTQYRIDQIIEEAISSSLIEGAKLSTRAEAKAMIRDERAPSSHGERMVLNNYLAMTRLLELYDRSLALDDLLEIHAILGADALDSPNAEGRLRTARDNVRVEDATSGETWFVPPPASELRERMKRLLAFANGESTDQFLHPLVRAVVLHFWLAYLHPFVDGNGRMARALFYWQLLRTGYDFAQYLSISGPIDRSPGAYYLAFAYTETDDGDLTYFLLNQLGVLKQATDELLAHLNERAQRLRQLSSTLSNADAFNHRQKSVLSYLLQNIYEDVTVQSHAKSHAVTYLTARKDLQDLEKQGLLKRVRVGHTDRYRPREGLKNELRVR